MIQVRDSLGAMVSYQYNSLNQKTKERIQIQADCSRVIESIYDAQGNTVEECLMRRSTKPEGKWEVLRRKRYQYTDFHQTHQVEIEHLEKQTKEVQENFYDAENLRYAIKENGKQTNFVTDGGEILSEMDEKGSVKKCLIWGYELTIFEEKKRKEEVQEGRYYYYHTNEHGDIEGITDEKGGVCNCYQYDAFGKLMEKNER